MRQPEYVYWALGVAWGPAALGIPGQCSGGSIKVARVFARDYSIEAATILVFAKSPIQAMWAQNQTPVHSVAQMFSRNAEPAMAGKIAPT